MNMMENSALDSTRSRDAAKIKSTLRFTMLSVALHMAVYLCLLGYTRNEVPVAFEATQQVSCFEAVFITQAADSQRVEETSTDEHEIINSDQSNEEVAEAVPQKAPENKTAPEVPSTTITEPEFPVIDEKFISQPESESPLAETAESTSQARVVEKSEMKPSSQEAVGTSGKDSAQAAQSQSAPRALKCPFPRYPRIALRKALEGIVLLEVTIQADGTPREVSIKQSSGHKFFDLEASETVKDEWVFAYNNNAKKTFDVTIRFELE